MFTVCPGGKIICSTRLRVKSDSTMGFEAKADQYGERS